MSSSAATAVVRNITSMLAKSEPGNPSHILLGIKECNKASRLLHSLLKSAKSLGEKQHLTTSIGQIKSYREMFKSLQITGEGYQDNKRKQTASCHVKWCDMNSAFGGRIRTGAIANLKHMDPKLFLEDCKALFRRRILNALKQDDSIKVNTVFCGEFIINKAEEIIQERKYMNTKNMPIYKDTDLTKWFLENVQNPILTDLEEFQEKNSGWTLSKIINLAVHINKFTPQLGSSYVELPKEIKLKHACINIRNQDNACFAWSVVSALHPVDFNSNRPSSYPHYSNVLKLAGLQFPITFKQIPRFEKQNDISINVYILNKTKKQFKVLPAYLTSGKKNKHVNLLMIQNVYYEEDDSEEDGQIDRVKYHFVWIKNLSRLLSTQMSKCNGKKYFCDRCLHYFHTEMKLEKHIEDCKTLNDCKIRLPSEDQKIVRFKNYRHKEATPFVVYADLECVLQPISDENKKSKEKKYQKHVPYSIGYYVKCSYDDSLSFYKSYRGMNCEQWFADELCQLSEDLETVFLCPLPMEKLTPIQNDMFNKATHCHICESIFKLDDKRVRDHCHFTGRYRGPAHENCNLNFQDSHVVPVVFHNLSNYDAFFIIEKISTMIEGRMELLPINKERYISFTKHITERLIKFRFIDSFRFMASPLDVLASYLQNFYILAHEFRHLSCEQLNLLKRKGVFPYDFIDSIEKLNHSELPVKSDFYNKLEDRNVNDDDYKHAQNVWNTFECNNLGDYSDLYLKTDILLLAEVFEQFRQSCRKTYQLDPANFYTLPGYAWECMLKYTEVDLELLTDIDMIMFIERGIRGGLSQCSKRYAKANNKYMSDYDPSRPDTYLMYYDINNQYGWSMGQSLPYGGFQWVENFENFNVMTIADESAEGYILEVDLEYPDALHDVHKDLPLCAEHLSPPGSRERKLMATLSNKTRYIIHYRNLKQAVALGVKLTRIHRILKFKQSPWLKKYIDLNTKLRANAKNEFEKNLFKLMNNAVFGKTMENIRKHSNVKLVTKWDGRYAAEALISKPEFKSASIFNENLVAIELNKTEIYFNKPIYVGMCILDLAKTTIYSFHYDYMRREFGESCNILYTDTDSLLYEINTNDIYTLIKRDAIKFFDTSDYPEDNVYGIPRVNKKVIGLMKDEQNGSIMTEFVGLRSKMYAVRVQGIDKTKKIKGIKKSIVKNKICFDDYTECLNNLTEKTVNQNLIKSHNHLVNTVTQTKIALSPHDDKRCLIKNSFETLPWNHYSIRNM